MVSQTRGGASYGSLRLWAAIGWGLAAVGMGAGVDRYGFSSVFIAYGIGTGLSSALVVACFENPKPRRVDDAAAAPASLASVFLVAPVPLYFLNFFIHGCLAAFVESYLLLFVATEWPSTPNWFLGLLILIAAVFEIPVFLYASRVIDRIGVRPCLVGAQFLFALRCTAYATLARYAKSTHGYLWFVLLEPSHALTFAMMWSSSGAQIKFRGAVRSYPDSLVESRTGRQLSSTRGGPRRRSGKAPLRRWCEAPTTILELERAP